MLGQDNLLLPGYSHRNEVSCLLGLQVSRNDQCGLNCREKKSRRGLILWKSYVVPSLAYCTHDTVETTEMRLGKTHRRERFRSPFAASPGLSQTQARFLYQGLTKSQTRLSDFHFHFTSLSLPLSLSLPPLQPSLEREKEDRKKRRKKTREIST